MSHGRVFVAKQGYDYTGTHPLRRVSNRFGGNSAGSSPLKAEGILRRQRMEEQSLSDGDELLRSTTASQVLERPSFLPEEADIDVSFNDDSFAFVYSEDGTLQSVHYLGFTGEVDRYCPFDDFEEPETEVAFDDEFESEEVTTERGWAPLYTWDDGKRRRNIVFIPTVSYNLDGE